MYCPKCGAQLDDRAVLCPQCKTRFDVQKYKYKDVPIVRFLIGLGAVALVFILLLS